MHHWKILLRVGALLGVLAAAAPAQIPRELQLSIQVVDDQDKPVSGAATYMEGDSIRASQVVRQTTDADGKAQWTVLNISGTNFHFFVNADGFEEVRGPRASYQIPRLARSAPITTIKLVRKAGGFLSIHVTDRGGSDLGEASVTALGRGLFGGRYTGTSDARGNAKIFIPVAGTYDVEVSNERYESWRGSLGVLAGGTADATVTLETKKDTSSGTERMTSKIVVTVLSGGKAVAGATVSASGSVMAVTNNAGRAILTGSSAIGDQVEVTAGADGYVTGTGSAMMQVDGLGLGSSRSTTGTVTIHLVSGADNLPGETPIQLVLDLRDSVSQFKAVEGAYVDLRFQNGLKMSANGVTGADGLVHFTIEENPRAPLAMVRKGINVEVGALPGRYKSAIRSITADLLVASRQQRIITIYVDPDNDGTLLSTVKDLNERVGALRAKWTSFKSSEASAAADAKAAMDARSRADATLKAIQQTSAVLGPAARACEGERVNPLVPGLNALRDEIDKAAGTALQLENTLSTDLSQANALLGRCAQNDAQEAKQKHLHAIQTLGQLGALEKRIKVVNATLTNLARQSSASGDVYKEATLRLASFDKDLQTARGAQANAAAAVDIAREAVSSGRSVTPGLRAEIAAAQAEQRKLAQSGRDAAIVSAGAQLQTLAASLASMNFLSVTSAAAQGSADAAAKEVTAIETARQQAQQFLSGYKDAACKIDPRDSVAAELEQRMLNATDRITDAADLPRLADECAKRGGPCMKLAEDARLLMKEGRIPEAQAMINSARTQGCSVADLTQELDYFKTIRDAAVYIETLNRACRYQDAINWGNQMPASTQQWRIIIEALGRSRSGLNAQTTARARIGAARQAAQASNTVQMEQNFQAAEQAAAGFSCPAAEVAEARANTSVKTDSKATVTAPSTPPTPPAAARGSYRLARVDVTQDKVNRRDFFGKPLDEKSFTFRADSVAMHDVSFNSNGGPDLYNVMHKVRYTLIPQVITPGQPVRIQLAGVLDGAPPGPGYAKPRVYFNVGSVDLTSPGITGGGLGDINDRWTTTSNVDATFQVKAYPVPGPVLTVELVFDGIVAAKFIYEKQ